MRRLLLCVNAPGVLRNLEQQAREVPEDRVLLTNQRSQDLLTGCVKDMMAMPRISVAAAL